MKVALVIPVKNESKAIGKLLNSILAQDISPDEVIIVDTGSTDNTLEIVKHYQSCIKNLRLLNIGNAFPGKGRNEGIKRSSCDYIALTDAGIILDKSWLRQLSAVARQDSEIAAVFGNYEPIVDTAFKKCASIAYIPPKTVIEGKKIRNHFIASSLIKRIIWKELGGFSENLRSAEDLVFMNLLKRNNYKIAYAPDALVHWDIPADLRNIFRRFVVYSRFNIRAGLAKNWQYPLVRLYVIISLASLFALVTNLLFLAVPLAMVLFRIIKRIVSKTDFRELLNFKTVFLVSVIIAAIDAATFVGIVDWFLQDKLK